MKNAITIISIFSMFLLSSCVNTDQERIYRGPVTIIAENETPIDAMRKIYLEFIQLNKPVLQEIIFHKEKKRYRFIEFSWNSYKDPSYYEYVLTDEANNFVSKHTGAEITASLMPVVMHPKYGGEAAVIITSILTHATIRNKEPSFHVSVLSSETSTFLHSTGYKSPTKKGKWNHKSSHEFKISHWGYTTLKGTPRHAKQIVVENSLHYQLKELGSKNFYYTHAGKRQNRPKIIDDTNSVEEWLNKHPFPAHLDLTEHNKITDKFGNDFTILGVYPDEINPSFLYYNLNLKKYWPVIFGYPFINYNPGVTGKFRKESKVRWDQYKEKYKSQLKEKIFELAMYSYRKR